MCLGIRFHICISNNFSVELQDYPALHWVPGNVLRRLTSYFCYLPNFTSHHHKYFTILIYFDSLNSQALNEADVFKTLFLKVKVKDVQKAPVHLRHWHIRRRSGWIYQMGFPSSRDCIGTMECSCLEVCVQFLIMTKRNLKFLVWEPIFCLINWGPPEQATHTATGAFSSLGETKLQILRSSKLHCFSKEFLCDFFIQTRFMCVYEDSRIFGILLFWYKLPVKGILESFYSLSAHSSSSLWAPFFALSHVVKSRYLSTSTKLFCQMMT